MKPGRKSWSPAPETSVDWSRPALHIANAIGVSIATVISYMRRNGLKVRPRGVAKGSQFKTMRGVPPIKHSVTPDWSKRDTDLGREHGCCREYMRQLRVAAGEPASGSMAWFTKYHEGKNTNHLHLN